MNNKFENRENKHINKKIAILSGVIVFALLISFFGTYFIVDRFTNPKYTQNNTKDKTVYNNTNALDDDMILVLMSDGVVEKEQSVSEFKEENSILTEINQQFIIGFFEANGYTLEEL